MRARRGAQWTLASTYARQVSAWASALGPINKSVAVIYMEGWERHGEAYMSTLLRMLQLNAEVYPWSKAAAAFARPVYQNVLAKSVLLGEQHVASREIEAGSMARLRTCVQQCKQLRRITGMRPPWCEAADGDALRRHSRLAEETC